MRSSVYPVIMVVLIVMGLLVGAISQTKQPTDKTKLELFQANAELTQAQNELLALPQAQKYKTAQEKWNALLRKAYDEAGVDPNKFNLNTSKMEFVPVEAPKPAEAKK